MAKIIELMLVFFKIGAFSFGGGYAMLPFIQREIVDKRAWISFSQFSDIIGISQMTPGPIAINSATFVGYEVNSIWGSFAATLGIISVSFILVSIATHYILKFKESKVIKSCLMGMRPALIGLIIAAFLSLAVKAYVDVKSVVIGIIIMIMLLSKKIHPILVIVAAGVLGIIIR